MSDVFLARQPIFDRDLEVIGYEILFRAGATSVSAEFDDVEDASLQVITNCFLEIGLDRVVGDVPAFLNLSRGFFAQDRQVPFPHDRVVLEILEGMTVDDELVASVRDYVAAGYRIALDDFEYDSTMDPLLDLAHIVKLDVLALGPRELERQVQLLKPWSPVLLAEKVETLEQYEQCREMGFSLFQGYFLSRPRLMRGQRVPPNRLATLRLLTRLQDPNVELPELERIIREDLSLSYKLLRLINSAYYGLTTRIESIRQTLVLLGVERIRGWVSLLMLSNIDEKPPELVVAAMVRAKMAQCLAEAQKKPDSEVYFTVGLFSLLDALLDLPMGEVLDQLSLSGELQEALLACEGEKGLVLACVLAYERGHWQDVKCGDLSVEEIRAAYLDAIDWAEETVRHLGLGVPQGASGVP